MTQEEIITAADGVLQWVEDAVGDMGYEAAKCDFFTPGSKWGEKIKRKKAEAKRDGLTNLDLAGWLADEYYNDVDILSDLCGDHIYDASGGSIPDMVAIATEIMENAHDALKTAMQQLIDRHNKTIEQTVAKVPGL